MVNEILKYDEYETKKIITNSDKDYKINTKEFINPEAKIIEINEYIKTLYGQKDVKLAICLYILMEKYNINILNELKNLEFVGKLENFNFFGAFLTYPPANLFTTEEPILKKKKIALNCGKPITLLHELRHFLTSIENTNQYIDDLTWFQRIGLSQVVIYNNGQQNVVGKFGIGIDEVCNVLQSEKLMNDLLSLRNIDFKNEEIDKYLKAIKNPYKDGYKDLAYYNLSQLMTPLLNNQDFVEFTDKCAVNGDLETFEETFDYLYGEYTNYLIFIKKIDIFACLNDNLIINKKNDIYKLKELVKTMANTSRKL